MMIERTQKITPERRPSCVHYEHRTGWRMDGFLNEEEQVLVCIDTQRVVLPTRGDRYVAIVTVWRNYQEMNASLVCEEEWYLGGAMDDAAATRRAIAEFDAFCDKYFFRMEEA